MSSNSRIHIFGASGSGVTTLGSALASNFEIKHFDVDDYYWKITDPPFVVKNTSVDRICAIRSDSEGLNSWILSGSMCNWGDPILKEITLAVYVELESDIRMKRLKLREAERYGSRIEPNGDMYALLQASNEQYVHETPDLYRN